MNPKHIMSSEDLMDLIVASAVGETTPEQIAAIAAGAPESAIKAL